MEINPNLILNIIVNIVVAVASIITIVVKIEKRLVRIETIIELKIKNIT